MIKIIGLMEKEKKEGEEKWMKRKRILKFIIGRRRMD